MDLKLPGFHLTEGYGVGDGSDQVVISVKSQEFGHLLDIWNWVLKES